MNTDTIAALGYPGAVLATFSFFLVFIFLSRDRPEDKAGEKDKD